MKSNIFRKYPLKYFQILILMKNLKKQKTKD